MRLFVNLFQLIQKLWNLIFFEPNADYILYYTDLALWHDGVSRFNREVICENKNLEACLKHAKLDFEKMLEGNSDD